MKKAKEIINKDFKNKDFKREVFNDETLKKMDRRRKMKNSK